MYLNTVNIQQLTDSLTRRVSILTETKEGLEREIPRLAENTELEHVLAQLRQTVRRLEDDIDTTRRLIAVLVRTAEIYDGGENRILDRAEGETGAAKTAFRAYTSLTEHYGQYGRLLQS